MGVLFKHGHPLKITSLIPLKISYIYIYLWEKKKSENLQNYSEEF